jgi:AcrR family transcriptional regulator
MASEEDVRITRTRELLLDALISLMRTYDASAISVAQLTGTARVNRSTFYLHYRNMHDFLDTESHRIVDEFVDYVSPGHSDSEKASSDDGSPQHGSYFVRFFEYVGDHADLFVSMLGPHGYAEFQRYFAEQGAVAYQRHLQESGMPATGALCSPMVANYIASAHQGALRWWLLEGRQYTPLAMSKALSRLTVDGILASLELDTENWIPS